MVRLSVSLETDFPLRHAGTAAKKNREYLKIIKNYKILNSFQSKPDAASGSRRRIGGRTAFTVTGIDLVAKRRVPSLASVRGQQDILVVDHQMTRTTTICLFNRRRRHRIQISVRRQGHGQLTPIDQCPAPFLSVRQKTKNTTNGGNGYTRISPIPSSSPKSQMFRTKDKHQKNQRGGNLRR